MVNILGIVLIVLGIILAIVVILAFVFNWDNRLFPLWVKIILMLAAIILVAVGIASFFWKRPIR